MSELPPNSTSPLKPSAPPKLEQTSTALTRLTGAMPAVPKKKPRRWGRWALLAGLLLIIFYAALPWLIPVPWLVRIIAGDLSRQLSAGQSRPIEVTIDAARSSLSWRDGLILADFRIGPVPGFGTEPLLTIQRLQTDFSPLWYLFTRHLQWMKIQAPVLRLVLDQNRRLNLLALQSEKTDLPALDILIEGGNVHLVNPANGETLVAGLKRIHTEIDPFAAKAKLSGEFLESLVVDGRVLIDPAETNPIRFAVDLNLPSLNPAVVLGGECKIGWDWVDLKKMHSERFVEVATGTTTQPAATAPARASAPASREQDWWQALGEGRIGGLSRASLAVKLLPDSRIHFSGKVEGKNLALPGLTQDQLSAELEGTWDPITKALELSNVEAAGDGWGVLPGTSLSYRPEADHALNLLAKLTWEPSRLAKAFGRGLPGGIQTKGRMETTLELTRRASEDRWKLEADLTPLAVAAEHAIAKPAGRAMSLSGSGTWQRGSGGLFTLEHVIFKAPGALAAVDFVELTAADRLLQEWSQQTEVIRSRGAWDGEAFDRVVRLAGRTLGKLSAQVTLRLDSLEQMAEWIVPLVEPAQRGQLAGGLSLRISYQPVDVAEETGQVQINIESPSDRPLRIYSYVDKPAGRLLTAEAGWQVNPHTGWFSRFASELALGRARVRLGTDAAWRVELDEDPQTHELIFTGDIHVPVKFEGLEQWIAAVPALRAQLSRQQVTGDARLDLLVRTQIAMQIDRSPPTWQVRALRLGGELDAEQLALALSWSAGREHDGVARPAAADFLHPRDRALKIAGDYRYLQAAQTPHEAWLQVVLDGGEAEGACAWSDTAQDVRGCLEIKNAASLLGQFPQAAKALSGRTIAGAGTLQLALRTEGQKDDRDYQARLSADLLRLKLNLPPEQFFKDDRVPLVLAAEGQASLRRGELARLAADTRLLWDGSTAHVSAAADLRGPGAPGGREPLDLWLRYGPIAKAEFAFDVEAELSNALRAGYPPLGKPASKYGLAGTAQAHGQFAGQPGEWTGAMELNLDGAGFNWRNWLNKKPGLPAQVKLPVIIAKSSSTGVPPVASFHTEPATLNVIFGHLHLGATRLDFSGGMSGQLDFVRLPSGLSSVSGLQVKEARGLVMLAAPQAGEWASVCPELADSRPEGGLEAVVLASWPFDQPGSNDVSPASRPVTSDPPTTSRPADQIATGLSHLPIKIENLDLSGEHFQLTYAGAPVGIHGELRYGPQRLSIPASEFTLGGQTLGILAEVAHPLDQPDGTVLLSARSFDQRAFSAWLERVGKRLAQDRIKLMGEPATPASRPAPIPTSPEFFQTDPAVYTPPLFADLFNRVKDWRLGGVFFAEHAVIELTKQDGPKNADDVNIRWKIAAGAFRMDFSTSQSGGRVTGNLAFPLTEPNPVFHLVLNFRDLIWLHTSAHTRFPGLWLYGYEDRERADMTLEEYDLPNPALEGVGSFCTLLDQSTARLFGPGGAMFYEGPGNWHVGQGVMIFGPGYLLGPTNQPGIAKIFPGLNTERIEIERVFNWYEKTAAGYQNDNMLFLSRSSNPLIPTYNFFAIGTTRKASTPDPSNPKYLLGNRVDYQIGLDLIGQPGEDWKNQLVGRVPLFRKTGYLVPGDREFWNPERGAYSAGKLLEEDVQFTPQQLIESLLWEAHPLRTAYQQILARWAKWQESLKKK